MGVFEHQGVDALSLCLYRTAQPVASGQSSDLGQELGDGSRVCGRWLKSHVFIPSP